MPGTLQGISNTSAPIVLGYDGTFLYACPNPGVPAASRSYFHFRPQLYEAFSIPGVNANVHVPLFIAKFALTITKIWIRFDQSGAGGSVVNFYKANMGTAIGSGTKLNSATNIPLVTGQSYTTTRLDGAALSTSGANQVAATEPFIVVLSSTASDLNVAQYQTVGLQVTGAASSNGTLVVVEYKPQFTEQALPNFPS